MRGFSDKVEPSMLVDFVAVTPAREKENGNANGTSHMTEEPGGCLRGAGNGQFLKVVHEDLQADVVCEDGCSRLLQPRHKPQGVKNMSGRLQHPSMSTLKACVRGWCQVGLSSFTCLSCTILKEHVTATRLTIQCIFLTLEGAKKL